MCVQEPPAVNASMLLQTNGSSASAEEEGVVEREGEREREYPPRPPNLLRKTQPSSHQAVL